MLRPVGSMRFGWVVGGASTRSGKVRGEGKRDQKDGKVPAAWVLDSAWLLEGCTLKGCEKS